MASTGLKTGGWRNPPAPSSPSPLSSPVVRRSNASTVLNVLRRLGKASRVDLARATGLTSTTAYRLVDHLSNLGLIMPAEVEPSPEGAGRRPAWYQFNSDIAAIAAVDVGNESTRIAVGDASGRIVATDHALTGSLSADLVGNVARRIEHLVANAPHLGRLIGASIGIAGIVDQETGALVKASQHREWDGVPLRAEFERALECPASVMQDDHLAALAEFSSLGSAKGDETLVVINQGKGIGAGFIVNGRPYLGAHGAAGRLESWLLPGEPEPTTVGEVLTADALVTSYHSLGGNQSLQNGRALCEAARTDDPVAVQVTQELAIRLGRIFFQLAVAFDPDVMVFGGGFAGSHDLFEPEIRRCLSARPRPPEFRVSALGENAVIVGAMQRGLEHVERYVTLVLESA